MDTNTKTTKWKCDCCGRYTPTNELNVVFVPEKEFDGVACPACEKKLTSKEFQLEESL